MADPAVAPRRIIHVDMDAFYASVEQRDNPALRGQPVVVAWKGARSVVCAASYEARKFGIRSAMPAVRAERACPAAIFVAPDFARYREVSRAVREIFRRYTPLIEPLSLDEAYLDVTAHLGSHQSATEIAQAIRSSIRSELHLTASAGVAPNKFLAKIASDHNKPDGLFVIKPHQALGFLTPLPVALIPGVGKVMNQRLAAMGITTVGQLREWSLPALETKLGSMGRTLYRRARAQDDRPVEPHRPVQSMSAEDTLSEDAPLSALDSVLERLSEKLWTAQRKTQRTGRTVILKLKTADFQSLTRSVTPDRPPTDLDELRLVVRELVRRVDKPQSTLYRLVGVGLGNFDDGEDPQSELFAESETAPT